MLLHDASESLATRLTLSLLSALTAWGAFAAAYALTGNPHPSRWLVAIGILEPIGLFAAIAAPALLVPRLQFARRVVWVARKMKDELIAIAVVWGALLLFFVLWEVAR